MHAIDLNEMRFIYGLRIFDIFNNSSHFENCTEKIYTETELSRENVYCLDCTLHLKQHKISSIKRTFFV